MIDKIEESQKVLGILDHKIEVDDKIILKIEQGFAEEEVSAD